WTVPPVRHPERSRGSSCWTPRRRDSSAPPGITKGSSFAARC
ncbi:MAG: hypothetical protein AVDCRST_MAG59-3727, partial [uncultured Thermomicrobiales bacterium]